MFSEYEKVEPIIYRQLKNSLYGNLSHAYLFNLNNNLYAENMVMEFVKCILCSEHKDVFEYNNCSKCNRISNGTYQELKIIKPEGLVIKKSQVLKLQSEFNTKPIESDYKIYIIYDVDKLHDSAANSLLKFLEEPGEGIIAILLTNNINNVKSTIASRCQILCFKRNNIEHYIEFNNIKNDITLFKIAFTLFKVDDITKIEEYHKNFINNVYKFITTYETKKLNCILNEKKIFIDIFIDRDEIIKFFECLILFYRDVINFKLNKKTLYFDDNIKLVEYVSNLNSLDNIIRKLNIVMQKQKLVRKNINLSMLLDGLIIDMEDKYE